MYRFLQGCTISLSALGVLGLALSGLVSLPVAGLAFVVVALSPFRRRCGINITERRYFYLLPLVLAILLADRLFLSTSLRWLMHLTLFLVAAKYWSPVFERDLLQIFTISFIHLVASAAVAQDVAFGFLLLVYVCLAVWALIAFNCARDLRRSLGEKEVPMEQSAALRGVRFRPVTHLPFVVVTTFSLVLLIGLTGFFFVLIPRGALPAMLRPSDWQDLRSGFSDRVELGSIGRIKLENEVVMRVILPAGTDGLSIADKLLWKGVTLDRFDGTEWSRSARIESRSEHRDQQVSGIIWASNRIPLESLFRQEIMLNPIGTQYLFGLAEAVAVAPRSGSIERLIHCPVDGAWSCEYPPPERLLYDVYSLPKNLNGRWGTLETGWYQLRGNLLMMHLQVPDVLRPQLVSLARHWTAGTRTSVERADAIFRHLRTEYTYTLDVGEDGSPVSLMDFLHRVKRGHCEYYASAMAMLLRAIGIPSRVVTGFLPGEWNPNGNYFIVRQRDAHSWVEAFLPRRGWVTYDPTPPNTGAPLLGTGPLSAVRRFFDSIELRWSRYVLSFQLRDQLGILKRIRGTVYRTVELARRPVRALRPKRGTHSRVPGGGEILLYVGILLVSVGVPVHVLRGRTRMRPEWRRRWRRLRLKRTQVGIARDYLGLIRYCEKRSHPKGEGDTYLEFAHELEEGTDRFAGMCEATALYYRGRFARSGNGRDDRERIRAISRSIRKRRKVRTRKT